MQVFYFLPSPTTDVQFNYDEPIVANAHRARGAASTCMLVNTRIIAKPRNRETAELCGEYHARTRCVARRNNNRCALNAKTRNERFSLLCEISIRWSSFEPRYSIIRYLSLNQTSLRMVRTNFLVRNIANRGATFSQKTYRSFFATHKLQLE